MNARLVFACAATGIALTAFAVPAGAATAGPVGEIAVVAEEQPPVPPPAQPVPSEQPSQTPAPSHAPAPPQPIPPQVPVTPSGAADTGSLDPASGPGQDAGVLALGAGVLLAAGGLGIAAHRRRRRM